MAEENLLHPHPSAPAPTAGAWLRAAREAAGVHIGALAVALKVPVNKLEALEADRIDLLPDAVFARALASSICRALKLDASEVLRLLPGSSAPSLEFAARPAAATVPTRMSEPGKSRVSRPVVVAVLLVVAALGLLVYPAFVGTDVAEDGAALLAVPPGTPPAADGGQAPGTATESASPAMPALVPAPAANLGAASAAAPSAVAPAPAASATAAPAASPAPGAVPAGAGGETLRITARSDSWVQVTDAAGATPVRRTLAAGESVSVDGSSLPLAVVVGRVDSVEVVVRGTPFDMAAVARNNIARFQVK